MVSRKRAELTPLSTSFVRVMPAMMDRLEAATKATFRSRADFIREAVRAYVANFEAEHGKIPITNARSTRFQSKNEPS